ncbi:MAG: hypothetical protein ACM3ML_00150 [Micromonosporaceae bacterium]
MPTKSNGWTDVVTGARRWFEGSAVQEYARRLKGLHFVNAIMLFGATFLLSALPFIIVMGSFANRRIDHDLSQHLGLNAQAARTVEQLFRTSSAHPTSAIVLALLVTGAGIIGVAGCVQGMYEQVFGLPHHSAGSIPRLVLWVAGLFGWLLVDSVLSTATHHLPAHLVLDTVGVLLATIAFFWWSMHLLPTPDAIVQTRSTGPQRGDIRTRGNSHQVGVHTADVMPSG